MIVRPWERGCCWVSTRETGKPLATAKETKGLGRGAEVIAVGRLCGLRFIPLCGSGGVSRWLPHLASAGWRGGLALSAAPADGYLGFSVVVFVADLLGSLFFAGHIDSLRFRWGVVAFQPGVLKGVELLYTNADATMASI